MPPTSLGIQGTSGIEKGTYGYVILGLLPHDLIAEVYISPWYFEALTVRFE